MRLGLTLPRTSWFFFSTSSFLMTRLQEEHSPSKNAPSVHRQLKCMLCWSWCLHFLSIFDPFVSQVLFFSLFLFHFHFAFSARPPEPIERMLRLSYNLKSIKSIKSWTIRKNKFPDSNFGEPIIPRRRDFCKSVNPVNSVNPGEGPNHYLWSLGSRKSFQTGPKVKTAISKLGILEIGLWKNTLSV